MSYNNPSYPPPASNKLPLVFLPQTYQAPSLTIRHLNPSPSPKSLIPTPQHPTLRYLMYSPNPSPRSPFHCRTILPKHPPPAQLLHLPLCGKRAPKKHIVYIDTVPKLKFHTLASRTKQNETEQNETKQNKTALLPPFLPLLLEFLLLLIDSPLPYPIPPHPYPILPFPIPPYPIKFKQSRNVCLERLVEYSDYHVGEMVNRKKWYYR